jgi:hypothetical protein
MKGIPAFNFPAFFEAEARLQAAGWEVFSPAREDVERDSFDPVNDAAQPSEYYMARDLPAVISCDAIALLPGWRKSDGATKELAVAQWTGKQVLDAETLEPLAPESILEEAQRLVYGDRQAQYGPPIRDMARDAAIWSVILGIDVQPWQVAACMVGIKLSRIAETPTKRDSWVDAAGWADVGWQTLE